MSRLTFPDEGSRLVYRTSGNTLTRAVGATVEVYSDAGATTLANIQTTGGVAISGSVLSSDAYSRIPLFLGPDGVDTVYVVVSGGPVTAVYARADDRIDALVSGLAGAIAGAETPAGAAAKVAVEVAARAAAITALSGTYALNGPASFLPGRKCLFLGTSLSNGAQASNFIYSYSRQACHMAGTLFFASDSVEAGTPGDTAAMALARIDAALVGVDGVVVIEVGPNDTALAAFQTAVAAMVAKAKAHGNPVVILTAPPRTTAVATTATRAIASAINMWLRLWAPSQGCEVAETYGALADPLTGDMLAAHDSGDGIHPNDAGHREMAQVVAAAMLRAAPNRLGGLVHAVQAANLMANPLMAGAGTNPTTSAGHTATGTASVNTCPVTDTSGLLPAGKWAQMDLTAGSASVSLRQFGFPAPGSTTWQVGDTIALTGLFQVEVITGDWEAAVAAGTAQITCQVRNTTSGLTVRNLVERCAGRPIVPGSATYNLGPALTTYVVEAGVTGLTVVYGITLPTGLQVKARFGTFGAFNATALGLVSTVGLEVMTNLA